MASVAAAVQSEPAATVNLEAAVRTIGTHASNIGREAAEVCGTLEEAQFASKRQGQALNELGTQVQEIGRTQDGIVEITASNLKAVDRARQAVITVGEEVGGIVGSLRQVSEAADTITQIALQTRLV
ncbi:MAG: chemotaxis protein, partial [Pseudorhodobacter sp.]|nr:chemotaxis protein [Rhizobacter sp.]